MAEDIVVEAAHDGTLESAAVREALTDLDVSESSPITPGAPEVGTALTEDTVTFTVAGHDGDFTKKSQTALTGAIKSIDEVEADTVEVVEGGYTPRE